MNVFQLRILINFSLFSLLNLPYVLRLWRWESFQTKQSDIKYQSTALLTEMSILMETLSTTNGTFPINIIFFSTESWWNFKNSKPPTRIMPKTTKLFLCLLLLSTNSSTRIRTLIWNEMNYAKDDETFCMSPSSIY